MSILTRNEANKIDSDNPCNLLFRVGSLLKECLEIGVPFREEDRFYVDGTYGSDSHTGRSWDEAFKTIQYAVNKARYVGGTTTLDDSKGRDKYIFVAPGHYDEQVLFSGYGIHIIGMGDNGAGQGGDYGVVLNYNNAVAATGVMGFTGVNIHIANICIQTTNNIPGIFIPTVSDGIHLQNVYLKGKDSKTTSAAIDAPSLKSSLIEGCAMQGFATGIKLGYAAGQWCYNNIIRNNHIVNVTNGITIANGAVGLNLCAIQKNNIIGSTGSITNSQATDIMIIENYVKPIISNAGGGDGDNTTLA